MRCRGEASLRLRPITSFWTIRIRTGTLTSKPEDTSCCRSATQEAEWMPQHALECSNHFSRQRNLAKGPAWVLPLFTESSNRAAATSGFTANPEKEPHLRFICRALKNNVK